MKYFISLMALLVALAMTSAAAFAAEVILTANGDGRYSLDGLAMDGVAGIELSIAYDSNSLSGPAVNQGALVSGAMMAANTNTPGFIKVAIISTKPFSGNGQILSVNFSGKSGAEGIISLNTRMIDVKGATLQSRASVAPNAQTRSGGSFTNSPGTFTQETFATAQNQQAATTSKSVTATAGGASIGMLTLSDEGKPQEPLKKQEQAAQPSQQQEQNQTSPATASKGEERSAADAKSKGTDRKSGEFNKVVYRSVLDRFKTFKGERTLAAFVELFTKPVAEESEQEPALSVSDGKQSVRILAKFASPDDNTAPNFAATEARVLSLKSEENSGRWIIDLTPVKGAMTSSVSILLGNRLYEIPLVVVPPARKLNFSEKEAAAFLKDYNSDKPDFDLNSDGKHDYRDDYIYTGHYLLNRVNPSAQHTK